MSMRIFSFAALCLSILCFAYGLFFLFRVEDLTLSVTAALKQAGRTPDEDWIRTSGYVFAGMWTAWGLLGVGAAAGLLAERPWARPAWLALVSAFLTAELFLAVFVNADLWLRVPISLAVCAVSWLTLRRRLS